MALAYGVSTAQTPTYTPMKSFYEFKGIKMDSLFLLPAFADTTSANTGRIKNIVGSVINVGGVLYERRNNKWNQLSKNILNSNLTAQEGALSHEMGYADLSFNNANKFQFFALSDDGQSKSLNLQNTDKITLWAANMDNLSTPANDSIGLVLDGSAGTGKFFYKSYNLRIPETIKTQNDTIATRDYVRDNAGTSIDTTSLSTRIDARVKYSDTATMLAPYLNGADTVSLSNRINNSPNFANTDLNATYDRYHNFKEYSLNIDSVYDFKVSSKILDFNTYLRLNYDYGQLYSVKNTGVVSGMYFSGNDPLMFYSKNNIAYLPNRNFGIDTIALKSDLGTSQNFANADLTATGNRVHNFQSNNLTIDTMSTLLLRTVGGTAGTTAQLTTTAGNIYSQKFSDGSLYGLSFSSSSNNVYLMNKGNQAYLSKKTFGVDTIALKSDIKVDAPNRIHGTATGNVTADMNGGIMSINNASILELKCIYGVSETYTPQIRLDQNDSYFKYINNNGDSINGFYIGKAGLELKAEDNFNGLVTSISMDGTTITTDGIELNINSDTLDIKSNVIKGNFAADNPFGSATLAAGYVTVNNTTVTGDSKIMLTYQNCVSCATIYIDSITPGTSFVIKSLDGSDASEVFYMIINP